MMFYSVPEHVWLQSWQRCEAKKIPRDLPFPRCIAANRVLYAKLSEYSSLVKTFLQYAARVDEMVEGKYIFKLFDKDGMLLTGLSNKFLPANIAQFCLKPGTILTEDSIGTNSLSLAMELHRPVFLPSEQHYCYLLTKWYGYAFPLVNKDHLMGYLVFSTYTTPLTKELIAMASLLSEQIIQNVREQPLIDPLGLSHRQIEILLLLSRGLTEVAIALELDLSVNTIKYHKKRIFFMLDARSTAEAVSKAIQYKLI